MIIRIPASYRILYGFTSTSLGDRLFSRLGRGEKRCAAPFFSPPITNSKPGGRARSLSLSKCRGHFDLLVSLRIIRMNFKVLFFLRSKLHYPISII